MRSLGLFMLAVLMLLGPALRAEFTMPLPDVAVSATGTAANIAIWSSTNVTEAAGNTIAVAFPAGMTVPAATIASCACVFMKFSTTYNGWAFTTNEVTVTAGSISGQRIQLALPQSLAPGLFYLRFDSSMGIKTPLLPGVTTLVLADTAGNSVESRGMIVRDALAVISTTASITGTVLDSSGKPVPGALVFATTAAAPGSIVDVETGPRAATPTAKNSDDESLAASTLVNGSFVINVPYRSGTPIVYNVYATYSVLTNGVLETYKTSPVSTSFSTPVSQSVTLPAPVRVCYPGACPG